MDRFRNQLATKLQRLSDEIAEILAFVREDQPEISGFPEWAAALVKERKCLICKQFVPHNENYRRGLDKKHWGEVWDRGVKAGKFTEAEAIAAGKIAPTGFIWDSKGSGGLATEIKARIAAGKVEPPAKQGRGAAKHHGQKPKGE